MTLLSPEKTEMPSIEWAAVDLSRFPHIVTDVPGPKSKQMHGRAVQFMKGYSSQVTLCPVVFDSGHGCTLTDVEDVYKRQPRYSSRGLGLRTDPYIR